MDAVKYTGNTAILGILRSQDGYCWMYPVKYLVVPAYFYKRCVETISLPVLQCFAVFASSRRKPAILVTLIIRHYPLNMQTVLGSF